MDGTGDSSLDDLFKSYMEKRDLHLNIVRELWQSLHNPIYNLSTKTEMINQLLREMDRQVIMHYDLQCKMLSLDLTTCLITTRRVDNFIPEPSKKKSSPDSESSSESSSESPPAVISPRKPVARDRRDSGSKSEDVTIKPLTEKDTRNHKSLPRLDRTPARTTKR
jgi:hypothetical protein